MTSKTFLVAECDNIESALFEILQHDYPAGDTEEFYEEIQRRLKLLRRLLKPVPDTDVESLALFCDELSNLSALVHHIERSRSGEFSWPFAEELRDLAIPICDESFRGSGYKPIFRIHADGGLASYRIHLENDLSQLQADRRVFSIVFPRTLKHHVLLHAIFGHELGHAALTIPHLKSDLLREVFKPLWSKGPISTPSTATQWLNGPNSPAQIRTVLNSYGLPKYEVTPIVLGSWFEEFFCDLFGLLTFGPAFLSAHHALLSALDPFGYYFGEEHPPYVVRRRMLARACVCLGWHKGHPKNGLAGTLLQKYWRSLEIRAPKREEWHDAFSQTQIAQAVKGLQKVLTPIGASLFETPTSKELTKLIAMLQESVPPCGADAAHVPNPKLTAVDFRHTLYAGWIVSAELEGRMSLSTAARPGFTDLNKLCERGLLQQRAINLYTEFMEQDK